MSLLKHSKTDIQPILIIEQEKPSFYGWAGSPEFGSN